MPTSAANPDRRPRHPRRSRRRSDEASRKVLALVQKGKLAPGARLPSERQLALSLGISRPILREALNVLEAMGYIDRRSKSGNYLCTTIPDSVRGRIGQDLGTKLLPFSDVIELRKALETWAVERAAEAPAKASLDALRACLATMEQWARTRREDEFHKYREADLAFHEIVARMTGNMVYIHLFDFLADLVRRSIHLSKELVTSRFVEDNLARHQRIFDAIARHDTDAARAAMQEHFQLVEKHLSR